MMWKVLSPELACSEWGEHIIVFGLDRGRLVSMSNLFPLEEIHQVLELLGVLPEHCSTHCRLLLVGWISNNLLPWPLRDGAMVENL